MFMKCHVLGTLLGVRAHDSEQKGEARRANILVDSKSGGDISVKVQNRKAETTLGLKGIVFHVYWARRTRNGRDAGRANGRKEECPEMNSCY